jgi:hypothetical protein
MPGAVAGGAISAKLRLLRHPAGRRIAHWCPGCEELRAIPLEGAGDTWRWNDDAIAPSLTPGVRLVTWRGDAESVCHYSLTLGGLAFYRDCTHPLAGAWRSLPDLPEQLLR